MNATVATPVKFDSERLMNVLLAPVSRRRPPSSPTSTSR